MNESPGDLTLHVHLLGDFRLAYGDEPVTKVNTPRLQSLLAYLVLRRDAPQSRHHLAFILWPDSTEAQALTNLRNLLHRLRRALPAADSFLHADGPTLQWQVDASFTLDVASFESALAQAEQAEQAGDPAAVRMALEAAATLYRGDLLPSCYDDWILSERERLHQASVDALERLILMLEDQRDYHAAINYARQLLRHDSLHEATYRRLMRLYALTGDRAGALRVYHTCATVLQRELSVEPGPATREMHERLLGTDVAPVPSLTLPPEPVTVSPLVGRQQEWAILREAWRTASAGQPHVVLIAGEVGIGKTRLAEELVQWAERQGIANATAQCYAAEGASVYAPVAAWLRARPLPPLESLWRREIARILPELLVQEPDLSPPGPLTEAWQRQRLFEALARAILGGSQPLLLLIDDLQWCDRETLEWLHYLLRSDPEARLLVVGTLHLEEFGDDHPLSPLMRTLRQEGQLTEIRLGPLNEDETATLATNLAGRQLDPALAACLHHETEGNPLFVVETVRAGLPDEVYESETGGWVCIPRPLPSRVQDAVTARLAQLTPPARELAELAAVIGREFTFSVLARASDAGNGHPGEDALVRALDELWQRHIVREQGADAYDFSHDKLREVALAGLSATRRRLLHRRVAGALESVYTRDLDVVSGQVATHYERGGQPDQALPYYRRAAAAAQQVYANDKAISYYQHLLGPELVEMLSASEVCQVMLDLGKVWQLTGQWARAEEMYRRALTHAESMDDVRTQGECQQALGNVVRLQGTYDEALQWLTGAYSSFEAVDDLEGAMSVLWTMGEVYWYKGDHSQALVALKRQLEIAADVGNQRSICDAAGTMGIVYWSQGDFEQSRACCQHSIEVANQIGHRWAVGRAAITMGNTYSSQSDYPQALDWYRQAFEVTSQIGDRQGAGWAISNIGLVYHRLGDSARALPCFVRGLQDALEIGDRWAVSLALVNIGSCYAGLGRPHEAEAFFAKGIALGRLLNTHNYLGVMLWDMADFYTRQGRHSDAQLLNDEALELVAQAGEARVAGEDLLFKAQVLSVRLRLALDQVDLLTAFEELRRMLLECHIREQQAVLHYEMWRLDQSQDAHRRQAADLYHTLYADAPNFEYRQRYEELTGDALPVLPSLPDLPEIVRGSQVDVNALLVEIDQIIAELADNQD